MGDPPNNLGAHRVAVWAIHLVVPLGLWCLPGGVARAQRLPDAGQLQQEIDRRAREIDRAGQEQPRSVTPGAASPSVRPADTARDGSQTVTLRRIDVSGSSRLSGPELDAVVSRYLGRPLTFGDIQRAAADVAQRYREAGWIVRTALPPQDLGDGVLRIEVIEAVFGAVRIEHDASGGAMRIRESHVRGVASSSLAPAQALQVTAVDRAVKLLEELPGLKFKTRLATGSQDRETDLVIESVNAPALLGSLAVDNQGSRSTGPTRWLAAISLLSPTGWGDRWSLQAMGSDGNRYLRAHAQVPWGLRGATIGLGGSSLAYRLTDPALAALGADGTSRTVALDAAYPVIRAADTALTAMASVESRALVNRAVGAVVSDYRIEVMQVGTTGHRTDTLGGGGVTSVSLHGTWGRALLEGSPHRDSDAQGPHVAGAFTKVRASVIRQQALADRLTLTGSFSAQAAPRNLDSSERFQIGGVAGVRAYSSGEASGRAGHLMSLEATWTLQPRWTASLFTDRGEVRGDRSVGTWQSTGPGRTALQGVGVASAASWENGLSARVVWARRIGRNPNPTPAGLDQDGTLTVNRLWLEAGGSF